LKKVYSKTDVILNHDISNECFGVYVALQNIVDKDNPVCYVDNYQIAYILTGKLIFDRRLLSVINKSIDDLIQKDIVKLNQKSIRGYELDLSPILITAHQDNFATISLNEVRQCFNAHKFVLLRHYFYLAGNIRGRKKKCWFTTLENIASDLNCSTKTVDRNNKALEKLKLIFVYRSPHFKIDDGDVTRIQNTYGFYYDMEHILSAAHEYEESYCGKTVHAKKESENIKSALMKYRWMEKGKKYDYKTAKKIFDVISKSGKEINFELFKDFDFYN